jgi:ribose transport system permease protein
MSSDVLGALWRRVQQLVRLVTEPAGLALLAGFIAVAGSIVVLTPSAVTYDGVSLLLSGIVPLLFVTMGQALFIAVGDIDLGVGAFVGLVGAVVSTQGSQPLVAIAILVALLAGYALLGWLAQARNLPSIILTLGASYIWLGLGISFLPEPGGASPGWMQSIANWQGVGLPASVLIAIALGCVGWWFFNRSELGILTRGVGSSVRAIKDVGRNAIRIRIAIYVIAGALGVVAGCVSAGATGSGDPGAYQELTLVSIAAVIIGGGEFTGGRISAPGAILGAVTLWLLTSLLALASVPSNLSIGAQGLLLIVIVGARRITVRLKGPKT